MSDYAFNNPDNTVGFANDHEQDEKQQRQNQQPKLTYQEEKMLSKTELVYNRLTPSVLSTAIISSLQSNPLQLVLQSDKGKSDTGVNDDDNLDSFCNDDELNDIKNVLMSFMQSISKYYTTHKDPQSIINSTLSALFAQQQLDGEASTVPSVPISTLVALLPEITTSLIKSTPKPLTTSNLSSLLNTTIKLEGDKDRSLQEIVLTRDIMRAISQPWASVHKLTPSFLSSLMTLSWLETISSQTWHYTSLRSYYMQDSDANDYLDDLVQAVVVEFDAKGSSTNPGTHAKGSTTDQKYHQPWYPSTTDPGTLWLNQLKHSSLLLSSISSPSHQINTIPAVSFMSTKVIPLPLNTISFLLKNTLIMKKISLTLYEIYALKLTALYHDYHHTSRSVTKPHIKRYSYYYNCENCPGYLEGYGNLVKNDYQPDSDSYSLISSGDRALSATDFLITLINTVSAPVVYGIVGGSVGESDDRVGSVGSVIVEEYLNATLSPHDLQPLIPLTPTQILPHKYSMEGNTITKSFLQSANVLVDLSIEFGFAKVLFWRISAGNLTGLDATTVRLLVAIMQYLYSLRTVVKVKNDVVGKMRELEVTRFTKSTSSNTNQPIAPTASNTNQPIAPTIESTLFYESLHFILLGFVNIDFDKNEVAYEGADLSMRTHYFQFMFQQNSQQLLSFLPQDDFLSQYFELCKTMSADYWVQANDRVEYLQQRGLGDGDDDEHHGLLYSNIYTSPGIMQNRADDSLIYHQSYNSTDGDDEIDDIISFGIGYGSDGNEKDEGNNDNNDEISDDELAIDDDFFNGFNLDADDDDDNNSDNSTTSSDGTPIVTGYDDKQANCIFPQNSVELEKALQPLLNTTQWSKRSEGTPFRSDGNNTDRSQLKITLLSSSKEIQPLSAPPNSPQLPQPITATIPSLSSSVTENLIKLPIAVGFNEVMVQTMIEFFITTLLDITFPQFSSPDITFPQFSSLDTSSPHPSSALDTTLPHLNNPQPKPIKPFDKLTSNILVAEKVSAEAKQEENTTSSEARQHILSSLSASPCPNFPLLPEIFHHDTYIANEPPDIPDPKESRDFTQYTQYSPYGGAITPPQPSNSGVRAMGGGRIANTTGGIVDTGQNDTDRNDTGHNDTGHNGTGHNDANTQPTDTGHNDANTQPTDDDRHDEPTFPNNDLDLDVVITDDLDANQREIEHFDHESNDGEEDDNDDSNNDPFNNDDPNNDPFNNDDTTPPPPEDDDRWRYGFYQHQPVGVTQELHSISYPFAILNTITSYYTLHAPPSSSSSPSLSSPNSDIESFNRYRYDIDSIIDIDAVLKSIELLTFFNPNHSNFNSTLYFPFNAPIPSADSSISDITRSRIGIDVEGELKDMNTVLIEGLFGCYLSHFLNRLNLIPLSLTSSANTNPLSSYHQRLDNVVEYDEHLAWIKYPLPRVLESILRSSSASQTTSCSTTQPIVLAIEPIIPTTEPVQPTTILGHSSQDTQVDDCNDLSSTLLTRLLPILDFISHRK